VIKDNGLDDRIKLLAKRSTDLTVGPGVYCSVDHKFDQSLSVAALPVLLTFNVLVSDLFCQCHASAHLDCLDWGQASAKWASFWAKAGGMKGESGRVSK